MDTILFFILGTIFGSFYNVVISRLPYGKSIVYPPSSCPVCHSRIRWYDNIPIVSYLILKGKCRNCDAKISLQYPAVEIITGIIMSSLWNRFGISLLGLEYFVLLSLLLCAAVIDFKTALDDDFETGIIPDEISIGGLIIGLFFGFLGIGIVQALIGAVVGFLILFIPGFLYKVVAGKEGMGGGDIKLFAMIGSFLGYKPLFLILFLSSLIGAIIGLFFIYIFKNKEYPIPFGPFIAVATAIYIYFGDKIVTYYMRMIYN